jgi:hypothetical protein
MSGSKVLKLFNIHDTHAVDMSSSEAADLDDSVADRYLTSCRHIVRYCEARFRVILQAMTEADTQDRAWMGRALSQEVVRRD